MYCHGNSGKITYSSVQEAFHAILSQNKKDKRSKSKIIALKPYRCNDCGGIHIGTTNIRPKPRNQ